MTSKSRQCRTCQRTRVNSDTLCRSCKLALWRHSELMQEERVGRLPVTEERIRELAARAELGLPLFERRREG